MISDSVLQERLHLYIRGLRKDFQASFIHCQDDPQEECVHDCRVYLRRWLALCDLLGSLFRQSSPSFVLTRKEFRKLHKSFGPLRDYHVSLSYLQGYKKMGNRIDELIDGMKTLSNTEEEILGEKLHSLRGKTYNNLQKSIKHEFQGLTKERVLYEGLKEQVSAIYNNTTIYVEKLNIEKIETFHSLRINLKKLRYTLEFLHSLDQENNLLILQLKELHDELGEIQDFEILGLNVNKILLSFHQDNQSILNKQGKEVQQWAKKEIHNRTREFYEKRRLLLKLKI